MEYLKVSEGRASPKRELRSKARTQRAMRSSILDTIAQASGGGVVSSSEEGGVVRLKIVVKNQELKKVLRLIGGGAADSTVAAGKPRFSSPATPSLSLEERLNLMRRRHQWRAGGQRTGGCRRSSWRPALQSIPEELQT